MDELRLSKAIARKCRDCCNGQRREVLLCTSRDCPLWPYRTGDEQNDDGLKCAQPAADAPTLDEQNGDQPSKIVPSVDSPSQGMLFD
jgi:hypothetical protein